ncbi:MAG: response regulator [Symploca sp. SIO1C4]|uniref:histidine kinase n=1 Tax=Symploca sp. SIO1C4 TaxID=2607765 RepID=A0A6B3N9U6_9CYAN|nr:response regulator [Symploca sp. SIO1C4]NET05338.1 response regulator [Symploca sp. SIO2B6]
MTMTILFVDDEISLHRIINLKFRKKIRDNEWNFIFASNGLEALQKLLENSQISLVITDINMPEMDGLTLLEKLNDIDLNLKAVVLSAYSDMNNIRTAMNLGAFDFATKPIDFYDLEVTINRTLDYVQKNRTNQQRLQQAQTQLIQSEKMSTIGQLVAGVAHEINNPVSFISANLYHAEAYINDLINHWRLYEQKLPNPGVEIENNAEDIELEYLLTDLPKLISSMKEGTKRISEISTSLRTFSRLDTVESVNFNIHEGIDSTLLILNHRLKGNNKSPAIEIIKEYNDLPLVNCYPGQINQVFMNLITNAIDALEDSNQGRSFADIKANPNTITICTEVLEDNNSVAIRIKDNGLGMSAEIQEQVFDYLFTTKAVGKGTGLGLSISRQIVEEKHRGKLKCISSPGMGSEFIVEIPISHSMIR